MARCVFPGKDCIGKGKGRSSMICAGRASSTWRLLQAAFPVPGLPPIVRDGENTNPSRRLEIDDVVRKTRHSAAAIRQVGGHSWNQRASLRYRRDLINGGVNRVEETRVRDALADLRTIDLPGYSASASSSKRTWGFTAGEGPLPRAVERLPRECPWILRP